MQGNPYQQQGQYQYQEQGHHHNSHGHHSNKHGHHSNKHGHNQQHGHSHHGHSQHGHHNNQHHGNHHNHGQQYGQPQFQQYGQPQYQPAQPQYQQSPPPQFQQYGQPQYQQPVQPQYQQPIQPQFQQGQVVVVNQMYVTQSQVILNLKETYYSHSKDDFKITDLNGRNWFSLDSKTFSMRDKRTLLDSNNSACVTLEKAIFSFGTKWSAYKGSSTSSSSKMFTIEPKLMAFKPAINIYLLDGDREPDFKVKGGWKQKDFKITDVRNGQKRIIAQCGKERKFQSMGAFFNNMVGVDSYQVTIEPGVDAAFITAICCILDEIYHDSK